MGADGTFTESRKHKRYKAKDWIFALFRSSSKLGQILDIGLGGFSFYYASSNVGGDHLESSTHEMNIFDTKAGSRLEKARCKVIYDRELHDSQSNGRSGIRRCGAQFLDLNHYQLSQVRFIIQDHTEWID
jgi:hypothetical protein